MILDMKSRSSLILFFISAFLALGLHWFCFEMTYIWYPPRDAARFWREGYIAGTSVIVALWIFFPSRLLVALVSTFMMFSPHLYPPGVVANMGRVIDIQTIGFALLIAAMFAGVTELRRRNHDVLKKKEGGCSGQSFFCYWCY